jgi:hypothetical protein
VIDLLEPWVPVTNEDAVTAWTRRTETDPRWPSTTLYASLDDWAARCTQPDHDDYDPET